MKRKSAETVRRTLDLSALPPLTERQRADLAALNLQSDDDIDHSDIATAAFATPATERGRFYRPVKRQITARLDADVLDWLKSQGAGYQRRMNAILRREMLAAVPRKDRGKRETP